MQLPSHKDWNIKFFLLLAGDARLLKLLLLCILFVLFLMLLTVWFINIWNCFDSPCGLLAAISCKNQYQYPSCCVASHPKSILAALSAATQPHTCNRNDWNEAEHTWYWNDDWRLKGREQEGWDGTDRPELLYHHNSNKGAGYMANDSQIFYKQYLHERRCVIYIVSSDCSHIWTTSRTHSKRS